MPSWNVLRASSRFWACLPYGWGVQAKLVLSLCCNETLGGDGFHSLLFLFIHPVSPLDTTNLVDVDEQHDVDFTEMSSRPECLVAKLLG